MKNEKQIWSGLLGHAFHYKVQSIITDTKAGLVSNIKNNSTSPLTEFQTYNWRVYESIFNLIHAIERLEHSVLFLRRYPQTKYFENNYLTLDKWSEYHYSMYTVTVVGLYDTALILTNYVFDLGLEPRSCNDNTVTLNEKVKNTKVKNKLKALNLSIQNYKDYRHKFVHRSKPAWEKPLQKYEVNYAIRQISKDDTNNLAKYMDETRYKHEKKEFIKKLSTEIRKLSYSIESLFDVLEPVYDNKCKELMQSVRVAQ
jgi:hypothetical protein